MPEALEFSDPGEAVRLLEARLRLEELRGLRETLLREGLLFSRGCSAAELGEVYAVDSAFPSQPVTLVGLSLSVVAVAAVRAADASRSVKRWLLVEDFGELEQDYVTGFARLQERLLALNLEGAVTLLLDGELVPRPGRSGIWGSVAEASSMLLRLPDRGVIIAGVLKRSYSRSIASRLGVPVSDRVLATVVLRRGEALIAPHGDERLRRIGCVEAFYKPLRGPGAAVKLEACCPRGVECCSLVGALAKEAGATGFPWALDLVDSVVKREAGAVAAVEALLLRRLAARELHYLGYSANPQEKRIRRVV